MQRLKTKSQFQALRAQPATAKTPHFALHLIEIGAIVATAMPEEQAGEKRTSLRLLSGRQNGPLIGALIPKRWAKRAVTRNAIRRQIYQVAEKTMANRGGQAVLVRLRASLSGDEFESACSNHLKRFVRKELETLMMAMHGEES
ncbi:MAG: ribonuclease P protein component [Hylemonella sp.]